MRQLPACLGIETTGMDEGELFYFDVVRVVVGLPSLLRRLMRLCPMLGT